MTMENKMVPNQNLNDVNNPIGDPKDVQDVAQFVQTLLQGVQDKFQQMSDQILGRIDDMGHRIDDLEHNLNELMQQAGVAEEQQAAPGQGPYQAPVNHQDQPGK